MKACCRFLYFISGHQPPGSKATFCCVLLRISSSQRIFLSARVFSILLFFLAFVMVHTIITFFTVVKTEYRNFTDISTTGYCSPPSQPTGQNTFQITPRDNILPCISRDFDVYMPKHLTGQCSLICNSLYSTDFRDSTMSIFVSFLCINQFTIKEKMQVITAQYKKLTGRISRPNITASTSTVTIIYL